jgi:hypothetical protein
LPDNVACHWRKNACFLRRSRPASSAGPSETGRNDWRAAGERLVIGPIFFEFIQRKGDDGFGEGNFRALFESIEEDPIRRGVLKAGRAA